MRAIWRGWLLALLAGLALLGPTAPSAKGSFVDLSLPASNGYQLHVFALSGTPVTMVLSKALFAGVMYAEYSVDGAIRRNGLRADFGPYGRIVVRFHPSSRRPPSRGCRRGRSIELSGRFVGTIRFRGDRGFSSVSATSAKGSLERSCERNSGRPAVARPSQARANRLFQTTLFAVAKSEGRSIVFRSDNLATRAPGGALRGGSNLVLAELEEENGRVLIERSAIVIAKPIAASPLGMLPITSSLTAPRPFSGTGSFVEAAGAAPSWTGDLQVDLPGVEDLPLTGPGFTTIFCRGDSEGGKLQRCEDEIAALESRGS
jgi:hypothetical protein